MSDIDENTSDGYHTFKELYEHRHQLFLALMAMLPEKAWISQVHNDGSVMDGWFIAGLGIYPAPVTYHLPNRYWGQARATGCAFLTKAPLWDGHTSDDVLDRLASFVYDDQAGSTKWRLQTHLRRQQAFSEKTFGPDVRRSQILKHIQKELVEIEEAGGEDLSEWMDVVILALDGAWRAGFTPEEICRGLEAKQWKNEQRKWPDWHTANPDEPIEHVRD